MNNDFPDNRESRFLLFQADDGAVHVNVRIEDETVWLTQAAMGELFACSSDNVSLHLKIFSREVVKTRRKERNNKIKSNPVMNMRHETRPPFNHPPRPRPRG